jgi:hypothetical protein
MARDASQALGAQQLAGAVVMPKGHAWQHLRVHTGLAGAVAGEAIAAAARKHAQAHPSQTPDFPRSAFLAVADREVALLRLGSGGIKNGRPSEVLARVPRSQVAMARVSAGLAASAPAAEAGSAAPAAAAGSGLTPDGTMLRFGQTARVGYNYGTGATTGPYQLTVTVRKGSISDLSSFDLDAQTKLGVPFYITEVVKNVGKAAGNASGSGGALTVKNGAGDDLDSLTLLGDFPTCQGNPPDSLAPGKQFTECDVYIAPRGQSVASVAYQNYDNTTLDQTIVTWKPERSHPDQAISRRRPKSAASRSTRSRLRPAHRPDARSARRLCTARCSASGPTLAQIDMPRRTCSSRYASGRRQKAW